MCAKDNQPVTDPRIKIVADNYLDREGLQTSWGYSCLIQTPGKTILFDTGGDGVVLSANMAALEIDPSGIDLLVLSHQHWDHIGGVYHVLDSNRRLQVYIPRSFSNHFKKDLQRYGVKLVEVQEHCQICPDVYSTGDLEGTIREQALLLQTPKGVIVITGCAHPGIVQITQAAQKILHDDILLVMGGFHLLNDGEAAIMDVIAQLKAMGVRYVAPSHCTGDHARHIFEREYKKRCLPIGAGSVLTLHDMP